MEEILKFKWNFFDNLFRIVIQITAKFMNIPGIAMAFKDNELKANGQFRPALP